MSQLRIIGGTPLSGTIDVLGAKNVALKILVASLLTDEPIVLHNVPDIRDVRYMVAVLTSLGLTATRTGHTVRIAHSNAVSTKVPLELGAKLRTSSMVLGPLLARRGESIVPNPGGCRLGARPIDRHIEALKDMGADIRYSSDDGYFYATAKKLKGADISFPKNTHTGTESLILAAVLAEGQTVLRNAAEEVEIDDLIKILVAMGAKITRPKSREIVIKGVKKLHGVEYTIVPDRNEEVTLAIAAIITHGDVVVGQSQPHFLSAFYEPLLKVGGGIEKVDDTHTRYFWQKSLQAIDVTTTPHPGFMTDWQAPWAVLMTQAEGVSRIHETVFESRFSYVQQLKKMGAKIAYADPVVSDPESFYNFNWSDRVEGYHQAIDIHGPTQLHNAILESDDIRAGASLVVAALAAQGESVLDRVEQIDRGYERIDERLATIGGKIRRVSEDVV